VVPVFLILDLRFIEGNYGKRYYHVCYELN
jgi:hypothetical protein